MSSSTIVIATTDVEYLRPLEYIFAKELSKENDLEVISDADYFDTFFSTPKKVSILVLEAQLYDEALLRHEIDEIFILTENREDSLQSRAEKESSSKIKRIFKYTSIADIYDEIMFEASKNLSERGKNKKSTQVVLYFSATGGAGKTLAALGSAVCLAGNHRRVFYIDAEYVQSFQSYLKDKTFISNVVYSKLSSKEKLRYSNLKPFIRKERFDYLPPFRASLSSLNIEYSVFARMIRKIKDSGDYDFIIVDMDSTLSQEKMDLFSMADRIIILIEQEYHSLYRAEILLNSISVQDKEKYMFVYNKYDKGKEKKDFSKDITEKIIVSEYIEWIEEVEDLSVNDFSKIKGFQRLAYQLL